MQKLNWGYGLRKRFGDAWMDEDLKALARHDTYTLFPNKQVLLHFVACLRHFIACCSRAPKTTSSRLSKQMTGRTSREVSTP
jgi:hypothetical protein